MFISVVIVAAGSGSRIKSDKPKQFINLCGKPILAYTIEAFQNRVEVDEIILVVSQKYIEFCREEIVEKYNFAKVTRIVEGAGDRQGSVYNGLRSVKKNTEQHIVLVHDGARPFVTGKNIADIVNEVKNNGCCVLGVRVKDTIKECDAEKNIVRTPEREKLWSIQTPQGFTYKILLEAHERARAEGFTGTDDGMLAERLGYKVKVVEGDYINIKITTEEDLTFASFLQTAADDARDESNSVQTTKS